MWELDPRFHTPGWDERRLKELRQEKESVGYWDNSDMATNARPHVVASHHWGPAIISPRDLEQIRKIVREELEQALGLASNEQRMFDKVWEQMGLPLPHGVTYRGYSPQELDKVIDFYLAHKGDVRNPDGYGGSPELFVKVKAEGK